MASLLVFAVTCILLAASASSSPSLVFHVGGPRGWTVPAGKETETYNHWATKNRFHVGDFLDFKCVNDSVLVVKHEDYMQCSTAKPVLRFADGETRFRFDRYGFFYFISGQPGHCEAGQRLIVRVMVHPELTAVPAGAPSGGGPSVSVSSAGSGPSPSPSPSPLGQASDAFRHVFSVGLLVGVGVVSALLLV